MDIKVFFKNLGLTNNEIKVYQTLIRNNGCLVSDLAIYSGLSRTVVYPILNGLEQKGLLTLEVKDRNKRVFAESPKRIVQILDKKLEGIKREKQIFSDYQHILYRHLNTKTPHPKVKFYEGAEAIQLIHQDVILSLPRGGVIYSFVNIENLFTRYPQHYGSSSFVNDRLRQKIKNRAILVDSQPAQDVHKKDRKEMRESRLIPPRLFPFNGDITLYANKVSIITLGRELMGVIIQSEEIFESFKAIFDVIWHTSKAFNLFTKK